MTTESQITDNDGNLVSVPRTAGLADDIAAAIAAAPAPTLAEVLAAGSDTGGIPITADTGSASPASIQWSSQGAVLIAAGDADEGSEDNGGDVEFQAGDADATGSGGHVLLTSGLGEAGAFGDGLGEHSQIGIYGSQGDGTGGLILATIAAAAATDKAGGDFKIILPAGNGTGRHGQLIVLNLPAADPHVVGALYSAAGAVKISAG